MLPIYVYVLIFKNITIFYYKISIKLLTANAFYSDLCTSELSVIVNIKELFRIL